ncbi:ribonuclease M5 [Bacillus sp. FJAT-49711]|uniref:ribonuclease M5 n=1 Tax=Bacillus sp. FJAT-49711 TaxID=2833585 RepID=UPI001BCA30AB|nr:ribonuclease M5 [Bacillus sp. FJAT-49711]MBS4221107.1 ribonuclease M5 [Bacillus sp. FJAT-49711]
MKIKEIIVVEGKDDTRAIQKSVDADTIETNGSAVTMETIEKIKLAQQVRGVIIFTDPDYPGEKIRKIISEHVPGCKHAFIDKKFAKRKYGHGLGVEHASREVIQEALKEAQTMTEAAEELISKDDLIDAGLIGGPKAKERRERIGELLKIGYTNGKQLHKRLMMFQISREDFIMALKRVLQEEMQ